MLRQRWFRTKEPCSELAADMRRLRYGVADTSDSEGFRTKEPCSELTADMRKLRYGVEDTTL